MIKLILIAVIGALPLTTYNIGTQHPAQSFREELKQAQVDREHVRSLIRSTAEKAQEALNSREAASEVFDCTPIQEAVNAAQETTHATLSLAKNGSARKLLCCNPFISVMKAAQLWNCDNLSNLQHLSRKRTLLIEA